MGWVKRALVSSVIWLVFLIIMLVGAFWYTNLHPPTGLTDEQISEKFGELFGGGLVLILGIWACEYFGYRKNQTNKKSNTPP